MYRDPQIRDYTASPPLIPGYTVRFLWPEPGDPDVTRIRTEVQNGAPGLYVLVFPHRRGKALVEAYYPEGIRPDYFKSSLDRYRQDDYRAGNLVAVNIVKVLHREVGTSVIEEIRRNNREARSDLKRQSSAYDRRLAIDDMGEAEMDAALEVFSDAYVDATLNTRRLTKIRNTSTRRIG